MAATAVETVPQEALSLRENATILSPNAIEMPVELQEAYDDETRRKMVPIHVIRPGLGRGRGRHLYEAKMLEENASQFKGWKMNLDHLSPTARKAQQGLPRSIRDAGGIVKESYWDPNVPADERHDKGAVVGWVIPTPFVRELIDTDPEIAEASISANATAVRPVTYQGSRAWIVEGIENRGSVDWVTEGGAGGRVVALMEAAYANEEDLELLESMDDHEFLAYVTEKRPHLLEAAEEEEVEETESQEETEAEKADTEEAVEAPATEGDTMGDITPEALQEALQDESIRDAVKDSLRPLVEEAVAEERQLIRAEAKADADRQITLRDMRDAARKQIEESRLPEILKTRMRAKFDLTDSGPTTGLDVTDQVDDDGKVTKKAQTVLTEALVAEIASERELLASVNPTRVTGQGAPAPKEGEETKPSEGTLWGSLLQEAGIDPEAAYKDQD